MGGCETLATQSFPPIMSSVIFASAPLQTVRVMYITYIRARAKRTWRDGLRQVFLKPGTFQRVCETRVLQKGRERNTPHTTAYPRFSILWNYSMITQWSVRWRFIRCLPVELPRMHVSVWCLQKKYRVVCRREFPSPSTFLTVPYLQNVSLAVQNWPFLFSIHQLFFAFMGVTHGARS